MKDFQSTSWRLERANVDSNSAHDAFAFESFEILQRKTFNFLLYNFVVLLARWRDWDWLYRLVEEKYEKGFGRGGQFSKPSPSIPLILRCLAFVFGYFSFCPCYHLLCLCFYLRMTQFSLSAYLSFVFVAVCLKRYKYVMLHYECLSCVREFSFLFVCFSVSLSFFVPSFWVKILTHSHFLDCPTSFWCCLYGITVW